MFSTADLRFLEDLRHVQSADTVEEFLDRLCGYLRFDGGAIWLWVDEGASLELHAPASSANALRPRPCISRQTLTEWLLCPQRNNPPSGDAANFDFDPIPDCPGLTSFFSSRLTTAGEDLGMIILGSSAARHLSEDESRALELLAGQAALLIRQARLLEQVRAGRDRAQTLSQRLIVAQETERRRLARELHDEVGQALTAIKLNLQNLKNSARDPVAGAELDDSIEIVDQTLNQVRNLSLDLRPTILDDLGLEAALRWYLKRHAHRSGYAGQFLTRTGGSRLPAEVETACFRVVQEALTNVARHAQARNVKVELIEVGDELHLVIRDDGVGFDAEAALGKALRGGSLGLLSMQERILLLGGRIDVNSETGQGTEIRTCLPIGTRAIVERRRKRRSR